MHIIQAPPHGEDVQVSIVDHGEVAYLVIVGADAMTPSDWDETIKFAYQLGWQPNSDDPDLYYRAADIEAYLMLPVAHVDREEDTNGEDRAAVSLGS